MRGTEFLSQRALAKQRRLMSRVLTQRLRRISRTCSPTAIVKGAAATRGKRKAS